ncbi:hypothetical protein SAMN04488044_1239 [Cognatishimia maritima]|uniref:Uncharacterized protein n=1 Tax=Cognatishimia maritima TaxID=870908 RepID=A0A1M5MHL7_9RHOB|nr:hypothetical protein SAMN04488044_1239 [Cognatishimia maritima]
MPPKATATPWMLLFQPFRGLADLSQRSGDKSFRQSEIAKRSNGIRMFLTS